MNSKRPKDEPYIPASVNLPEVTLKAVVLSIILSVLLGAANAYLGLFAGMTVSASIPASVLSMALFRLFKKSNILENNIVQTAASAGEGLAGGVIFTLPALLILGSWTEFNYWETTLIASLGGILGMLFTIPLRRAMIVENPLQFPEGVATAEVLKVGEQGGSGIATIATAGIDRRRFQARRNRTAIVEWCGREGRIYRWHDRVCGDEPVSCVDRRRLHRRTEYRCADLYWRRIELVPRCPDSCLHCAVFLPIFPPSTQPANCGQRRLATLESVRWLSAACGRS